MNATIALIADVRSSRRHADFRARRDQALAHLSRRHLASGATDANYAITAWDEFQALLVRPAALPDVLWDIHLTFQPMTLRLGLGGGAVERDPDRLNPVNETATGPAFVAAREAINALSSPKRAAGAAMCEVRWPESPLEPALNAALKPVDVLISQITATQWRVIDAYERLGRQDRVAEELSRNESTISRSLAAAHYWDIKAALADVNKLLHQLLPSTDD
jgi:hypothetical protein